MQQYEITYDAIIEDLARAGKILDPEDLAITYLNTLPDTYSSLIQSMEPVLSTLTSQSIKAKVRYISIPFIVIYSPTALSTVI